MTGTRNQQTPKLNCVLVVSIEKVNIFASRRLRNIVLGSRDDIVRCIHDVSSSETNPSATEIYIDR